MRSKILAVAAVTAAALVAALPAMGSAGKGMLFHDGDVVRTVVVSQPVPDGAGTDPFFEVTNGAEGQLGIAEVAPGDAGYHGGLWQVWLVTFRPGVTPYLLTSDEAVRAAEALGDVDVVRDAAADFRCPVQP